jgi:hypothetical protein
VLHEPREVLTLPMPVDVSACAEALATDCVATSSAPGGCVGAVRPGLPSWSAAEFTLLHCSSDRVLQRGAADGDTLTLHDVEWSQSHLRVQATEPSVVELVGGRLDHVSLAVAGPVTLRLVDVQGLADLRVLVADDSAVRMEVVRSAGAGLTVSGSDAEVLVRRSRIDRVGLWVKRITLESSSVTDGIWEAQVLDAADSTLERIASAAERSVFAGCQVGMARFSRCQSLTAVLGYLHDVHVQACAEEVALYGANVQTAQIEGETILDSASLTGAIFGVGTIGPITAWDSTLTSPTFCDPGVAVALGSFAWVRCARCDLAAQSVTPDACFVDDAQYEISESESCPSLQQVRSCSMPEPVRMRPPRG